MYLIQIFLGSVVLALCSAGVSAHQEFVANNLLAVADQQALGNQKAEAKRPQRKFEMHTETVVDGLYVIISKGPVGNVGVSIGEDGTFLIDDQFKFTVPELLKTVKDLGGSSPKFLVNTHYHFDHAGGNAALGATGAVIAAHDSVRKQLASGSSISLFNSNTPPAPKVALPVITFGKEMNLHVNGDHVRLTHLPNAHTEGDIIVQFLEENVIHTGDVYMNTTNYPFIDTEHGGSLAGMIEAQQAVALLADDATVIIPGHGNLATKAVLIKYTAQLSEILKILQGYAGQGSNVEQVIAAKPVEKVVKWNEGIIDQTKWIGLVYPVIKEVL